MSIEVAFFGTLSRDAEIHTSKSGRNYLRFNVRVGEGDAVQWVNCTVLDPKGIEVADRMVRGARVYCEGRLSLDEWTGKDGTARHSLACLSWHCRPAQIGRNKPRRNSDSNEQRTTAAESGHDGLDDVIPPL
jgi:single-stranded DNA-binding protein